MPTLASPKCRVDPSLSLGLQVKGTEVSGPDTLVGWSLGRKADLSPSTHLPPAQALTNTQVHLGGGGRVVDIAREALSGRAPGRHGHRAAEGVEP